MKASHSKGFLPFGKAQGKTHSSRFLQDISDLDAAVTNAHATNEVVIEDISVLDAAVTNAHATNEVVIDAPSHIDPKHYKEWLDSAVDETLTQLNVKSLFGTAAIEHLIYALPDTERRNDRRLRDRWINRYSHTEKGGWWISGLDPLNDWQPMEWGRFKPDFPLMGFDKEAQKSTGKPVKYESPAKTPNRVTYFRVPLHIWKMVAKRYNVLMPEHIIVTPEGEAIGFWAWIVAHPQIPITLTEGEKKAAALLSLGIVAIALPGIWNGRVGLGELEKLHPDLIPVAQTGRDFIILYDYETKPKTRRAIYQATCRTGWAIIRQGCRCKVALLPGQEKGIDDWIVALKKQANQAVTALINDARTLTEYQAEIRINRTRGLHKYKPNVIVHTRYLSEAIPKLPESGLVGLDADMGTGKTELLARWRQENSNERFLNNGHRVNLLKNLTTRLSKEVAKEKEMIMYSKARGNLGDINALSITVDSLYKLANNLEAYGCVFIDEACQYLAHLLKSKTCKEHRAEILEVLECIVYQAKLVVLADAHLDDLTIDFFLRMRPEGEQPYIIKNTWKSGGRKVYWYEGANSSGLVAQIHAQVLTGKKAIVVSDSKRFIKKLERSFSMSSVSQNDEQDDSPEPEADRQLRVWAIHSENSGSPENELFIEEINTAVKSIDVLLASPSLGTGVDIKDYHFDVIFGAFHSVSQSATECAQQLWRYRPNVPMHVWVAPRPPFGYVETNTRRIKEKYLKRNEMTAFLIRIDRETGKRGIEKEWALDISCEIEARRNWSINNLRTDLRLLLESMENTIIPLGDKVAERTQELMKELGGVLDREHYEGVANAKDIDRDIYKARQSQDYLNPEEVLECEKFRIQDAYGMKVTPELVEKDDSGRLIGRLVALEAILLEPGDTITDERGIQFPTPPQLVVERDLKERERLSICTDWANYSTSWLMRYKLGLREILIRMMDGQEVFGDDPLLRELEDLSHNLAPSIKAILNLTVPTKTSPQWILGKYLTQLGLSTSSRRVGGRGEQVRYYSLDPDNLDFAKKVLAYRQQVREQKERSRQLDREIAERRIAGLQAQYGIAPDSSPVVTSPPNVSGESFLGGSDYQANEPETPQLAADNQEVDEWLQPENLTSMAEDFQRCKHSNDLFLYLATCPKRAIEAAVKLLPVEFGQWVMDWFNWWWQQEEQGLQYE
jgi:flagellar biosynthesis regulator FlaF